MTKIVVVSNSFSFGCDCSSVELFVLFFFWSTNDVHAHSLLSNKLIDRTHEAVSVRKTFDNWRRALLPENAFVTHSSLRLIDLLERESLYGVCIRKKATYTNILLIRNTSELVCPAFNFLIHPVRPSMLSPVGVQFQEHESMWNYGRAIFKLTSNLCPAGVWTWSVVLPWPKKRTILEIRGEKNAVPRVISCSIRRDQRRAKVADVRGSDLPCADRAWSSMISHVEQRSSRRESRWWFFFLARVVQMMRTVDLRSGSTSGSAIQLQLWHFLRVRRSYKLQELDTGEACWRPIKDLETCVSFSLPANLFHEKRSMVFAMQSTNYRIVWRRFEPV